MNEKTADHVIEVKNLTRKFRRKLALDGASLNVPSGCVFGLLGENGSGKRRLSITSSAPLSPNKAAFAFSGWIRLKSPSRPLVAWGIFRKIVSCPPG